MAIEHAHVLKREIANVSEIDVTSEVVRRLYEYVISKMESASNAGYKAGYEHGQIDFPKKRI